VCVAGGAAVYALSNDPHRFATADDVDLWVWGTPNQKHHTLRDFLATLPTPPHSDIYNNVVMDRTGAIITITHRQCSKLIQFISTDPPGVGPQLHALPYAASICMNFDSGLVMAAMGTSANNDLEVMCTAETLRAILFGRLLCWPVKSQNTIDRIINHTHGHTKEPEGKSRI
jgi:hypothetical protein